MIGFPPATTRDALASLAFRLVLSAVALGFAIPAWHAPAPGIPSESNYWLVLLGVGLAFWCASAAWTLVRMALRASVPKDES